MRFCGACGTELAPAAAPRQVRKTVTIVFCDVSGSTALGERLDPEALRRTMGRYFEEIRAVVERHGGLVEKFIGDAVMAVFGIPTAHEDDAVRAVRAVAEMRERLQALGEELAVSLSFRTGVNTGEVVAGRGRDARHGRRRQRRRPVRAGSGCRRDPDRSRDPPARPERRHGRGGRAARAEGESRARARLPARGRGSARAGLRPPPRRAHRRAGARAEPAARRLRGRRLAAGRATCSRCSVRPAWASRGSSSSSSPTSPDEPKCGAAAASTTATTSRTGRSSRC